LSMKTRFESQTGEKWKPLTLQSEPDDIGQPRGKSSLIKGIPSRNITHQYFVSAQQLLPLFSFPLLFHLVQESNQSHR
jgi:hypothetical protein